MLILIVIALCKNIFGVVKSDDGHGEEELLRDWRRRRRRKRRWGRFTGWMDNGGSEDEPTEPAAVNGNSHFLHFAAVNGNIQVSRIFRTSL